MISMDRVGKQTIDVLVRDNNGLSALESIKVHSSYDYGQLVLTNNEASSLLQPKSNGNN
jgi:hypothetical protein